MSSLLDVLSVRKLSLRGALIAAALALAASMAAPAPAESPAITLATLVDRAQIENMLATYFAEYEMADGKRTSHADLGSYYVENGVLEVYGKIEARDRKEMADYYPVYFKEIRSALFKGIRSGRLYMRFTNPRITVHGDSATVDVLWSSIATMTPKAMPQIIAMGREHDELVKRHGRWYFNRRVISQ